MIHEFDRRVRRIAVGALERKLRKALFWVCVALMAAAALHVLNSNGMTQ